jgi:predicted RNA binding protein YcfA (HicA-like mRNA interferase family)
MKIRTLKDLLRKQGYTCRPGKGSHSIWTHPTQPDNRLVLHGAEGDDAKPYLVVRVRKGLMRLVSHRTLPRDKSHATPHRKIS